MGPWLRRKDSNLQSPDPESGGLPISRLLKLPSFAESQGCKPVDECEVGTLHSLGARPSQPKRLLRRSRQGGCASEGSALRSAWRGATTVRPWGSTRGIKTKRIIARSQVFECIAAPTRAA